MLRTDLNKLLRQREPAIVACRKPYDLSHCIGVEWAIQVREEQLPLCWHPGLPSQLGRKPIRINHE
jgi:hypothetical protein